MVVYVPTRCPRAGLCPLSSFAVLRYPLGAEVKTDDHREDGQELRAADGPPQGQRGEYHGQGDGDDGLHRQQVRQPLLQIFHKYLLIAQSVLGRLFCQRNRGRFSINAVIGSDTNRSESNHITRNDLIKRKSYHRPFHELRHPCINLERGIF